MMTNLIRPAIAGLALAMVTLAQQPAAFGTNGCGLLNEPCCQTDPLCEAGAICVTDTCVPCGGLDQFCCLNEMCNSGLTCIFDLGESAEGKGGGAAIGPLTCVPCGGYGEPCCDPDSCDPGFVCEPCPDQNETQGGGGGENGIIVCPSGASGVCEPCGGLEEDCCEGGVCDEGFHCEPLSGETIERGSGGGVPLQACLPCGALGLECCDGETCLGESLVCGGQLCEACGEIGEQCCANETCPASGGLCVADVCTVVPSAAAMNRKGLILLVVVLTAVAGFWMRRLQA